MPELNRKFEYLPSDPVVNGVMPSSDSEELKKVQHCARGLRGDKKSSSASAVGNIKNTGNGTVNIHIHLHFG